MKTIWQLILIILLGLFIGCDSSDFDASDIDNSSVDFAAESGGTNGTGDNNQSGIVTAAEWNDLDHWNFWNNLLNTENFDKKSEYWEFYTNNRVSVVIKDQDTPVANLKVVLKNGETIVWSARTDNNGLAELWIDLFKKNTSINISSYTLYVDDTRVDASLKLYGNGINEIQFTNEKNTSNRVELSFVVDATGSMGDELEFLKDDLQDVITKVKIEDADLDIYTSTVFYRDLQDEYLVKSSEFTNDLQTTLNFINEQSANGGGDYPEAVETALEECLHNLQWSSNARTRILFLILDAPPHYEPQIIIKLQNSIKKAAENGIKIIPITASGIDKNTEFLMRFFSIGTNGTYTFITNDSGVGNDHIEASVGEYQVEQLNNLMVRLIKKYTR